MKRIATTALLLVAALVLSLMPAVASAAVRSGSVDALSPADALAPRVGPDSEPLTLTAGNATSAFKRFLAGKYKASYTEATSSYVKCANLWTDEDTGTQYADCSAEFGTGNTWRSMFTSAQVEADGATVTVASGTARKWTRQFRKAGPTCLKSWRVRGTLYANTGACAAALAFHFTIYKGKAYTVSGGTGSGSFPKLNSYPCTRKGRTYICTNAMGDAIRWTPATAKAKATPKPKAPSKPKASSCDPNYSGCLKPNVSDYDCAGGSGNGPYYTGQVTVKGTDHYALDADGDGIGCESRPV